jgi:intraflagellar transport protein 56
MGRQCLASYFFLKERFEDVVLYLRTIKEFNMDDDAFHWNFGMALAKLDKYEEAEEHLTMIKDEQLRDEFTFNAWLARCFIQNGKPESAWNLYLEMNTSNETLNLLTLIGEDGFCY